MFVATGAIAVHVLRHGGGRRECWQHDSGGKRHRKDVSHGIALLFDAITLGLRPLALAELVSQQYESIAKRHAVGAKRGSTNF